MINRRDFGEFLPGQTPLLSFLVDQGKTLPRVFQRSRRCSLPWVECENPSKSNLLPLGCASWSSSEAGSPRFRQSFLKWAKTQTFPVVPLVWCDTAFFCEPCPCSRGLLEEEGGAVVGCFCIFAIDKDKKKREEKKKKASLRIFSIEENSQIWKFSKKERKKKKCLPPHWIISLTFMPGFSRSVSRRYPSCPGWGPCSTTRP